STLGWTLDDVSGFYKIEIGELQPGDSGQIELAVVVNDQFAAGIDDLDAAFTIEDDGSSGEDPDIANNAATITTPLDAAPDLTVEINTSELIYVQPGDTISFDLAYENIGNQDATNVILFASLPTHAQFDSENSSAEWVYDSDSETYQIEETVFPEGQPETAIFSVDIDETSLPSLTSVDLLVSIEDDGTNGDDLYSVDNDATSEIPYSEAPDLNINLIGIATIQPGALLTYQIEYSNLGFNTATGVVITESVPDYATFNSENSDMGWENVAGTDQYTYSVGSLSKGDVTSPIAFAITIDSTIPDGVESITNTASISDDGENGVDPDSTNNSISYESIFSTGPTTISGTITENATWSQDHSPYVISGSLTIDVGVTLTLEPGTVVKFYSTSSQLIVNGALSSIGNSTKPITFTSYKDDSVGGDTNGDGNTTSPAPGNWTAIRVNDTGVANFAFTRIRYGGYSSTYYGNLYLTQNAVVSMANSTVAFSNYAGLRLSNSTSGTTSQLSITDSIISDNNNRGIYVSVSSGGLSQVTVTGTRIENNSSTGFESNNVSGLNLTNSQINNNGSYAAYLTLAGNPAPDLTGVTAEGNAKNGVALVGPFAVDSTLTLLPGLAYLVPSAWTINSGATLTILAGQTIKAMSSSGEIYVHGVLIAQGDTGLSVNFTSFLDDGFAGDSNNDLDGSLPSKGDWEGIYINPGGSANLDHVVIRYGAADYHRALVWVDDGGSLTLTNSLLEHSAGNGVESEGSESIVVENNTIQDCTSNGIHMVDDSDTVPLSPQIHGNVINNTNTPIFIWTSSDGYTGEYGITNNIGTGNTNQYIRPGTRFVGTVKLGASNGFDWGIDNIAVAFDGVWDIGPGEIYKTIGEISITVQGTMQTNGTTASDPAVFTDACDNDYGHTICSDAIINWEGIYINPGGSANLDHVVIRYGAADYHRALVWVDDGGSLT
ncbi:MAG: right-handed parallel beta-helix repeat-containing protein, partial [Chloroflexota bacterium]|nr:right-handed parallel beta-helix repeat-containing protein [Chloroflexota bacterium]